MPYIFLGSAALVCLYNNLNDATIFTTKTIAEYATLLQVTFHFRYCICYLNMDIFSMHPACLVCNHFFFNNI
jgi:hypothetical protein